MTNLISMIAHYKIYYKSDNSSKSYKSNFRNNINKIKKK